MVNTTQTNKTSKSSQWINILPAILVVLIIPLAVKGMNVNTNLSNYVWYSNETKTVDIFMYYKSILFLILCGIMLIQLLYSVWHTYSKSRKNGIKDSILNEKCLIPLIIYLILTIVSTIVSDHNDIALQGLVGQFESMWVLLGYGLIVFYTYVLITNMEQIKAIIYALVVTTAIISVIGLSQFLGHDFFQTSFGKSLISKNDLSFRFDKGHVYSTLFNPNYVGLFAALVIPLFIVLIIHSKGIAKKLTYAAIAGVLLISAWGSKSSSGIIGIVAGTIMLLIFIALITHSSWAIHTKKVILGIVVLLIVGIAGNFIIGNPLAKGVTQVVDKLTDKDASPNSLLSDITTKDNEVSLVYNSEELSVQFIVTNGQYDFLFYDSARQQLPYVIADDGTYVTIQDPRFEGITISLAQIDVGIVFEINVEGKIWSFTNQTDGTYYYCNAYGKLLKLDEHQDFRSYWTLGSGRGYIWSRSISIIKEHFLLGTGPDTYALYFPNTEYLNLYHAGFNNQIITKPHSLYLQIASQTGIPSLIAFLVFYFMYVISSIRLFCKHSIKTIEVQIGIGILAGTVAYMVSCLANDSTVTVAPVFWTLIGVGLSINHLIKKRA